jgi:Flp pilus assembly pilin Flp
MRPIRELLADREGAAVIEFAMICGFIVIAIIGSIVGLGTETDFAFSTLANKVALATAAS